MGDSFALFAVAAFLLAGLVKGVIGLGLPVVAIGLLALVMPPAQAAALLVVPSLVTNLWQVVAGPQFLALVRRLGLVLFGIVAGIGLSPSLLTTDTSGWATFALGVALALYALLGLTAVRFRIPRRAEPWVAPLVGLATGAVAAATGIFAIPSVPYLQAIGLEKDDLVQALGLIFTVSTVALGVVLARDGVLGASTAAASLMALVPALGGMVVGQLIRSRIQPAVFRLIFLWGLLALGIHLAVRTAM